MKKILLLLLVMTFCTVCHAEESCANKTYVENFQFNINAKSYKFTSYFCEDKNDVKDEDEDEVFSDPAILEIQAKNFNKSLKNVIGIKGMVGIMFWKWNNKPQFYYYSTPSDYTEAVIPIIIKDNNLMVDCIYINKRLKNLMETNYSYCGDLQIVEDGFGNEGFEDLFPDFYLEPAYYNLYFSEDKESLQYKEFDGFIGKIDDISFYRRYSSIKDFKSNKYTVVMVNKEKEYRFNQQDEIYQRMAGRTSPESFIGLDIIDSKGNIKFYDRKALSALLNKSTIKRNIKSYIQNKHTQLYNQPNDNSATDMYLLPHDFVTILDEIWNKDNVKKNKYLDIWYKISYHSKEHGKIIKWIKEESFDSKGND
ncbi:hypothetical protein ACQP6C_01835 [Snodgrassella alvi]|uniref:hypothetical protein n=1 Tax=Snodgrassella alvi TaxID=1196083 RepID=UPI003D075729